VPAFQQRPQAADGWFSVQHTAQQDGFQPPAFPPASPPPARPWLLADIGGTNARFGWVDGDSDEVRHVATLRGAAYAGPTAAAQAYLAQLQQTLGTAWRPPAAGAFAVATAIVGDRVAFTNSGWAFSRADVERELGLQPLLILNDFEALARSVRQPARWR
jgi:glucokinase